MCRLCGNPCFGRTIQYLCKIGTRGQIYVVLTGGGVVEVNDDYFLGLHSVHEDGVVDRFNFDKHYHIHIVEKCSPSTLEKKERLYNH